MKTININNKSQLSVEPVTELNIEQKWWPERSQSKWCGLPSKWHSELVASQPFDWQFRPLVQVSTNQADHRFAGTLLEIRLQNSLGAPLVWFHLEMVVSCRARLLVASAMVVSCRARPLVASAMVVSCRARPIVASVVIV